MSKNNPHKIFQEALHERGRRGGGSPRLPDPLPNAITAAREKQNLSRRALSGLVGCSDVFIGKIEAGKKIPRADLLAKLQEVLGLSNRVIQLHIHSRPYQFRMGPPEAETATHRVRGVRTSGGNWDEVPCHEKAVQLMLAAGVALRSNGYPAQPQLPTGREQSNGVLPWIEVDLGDGAVGIITIEVRRNADST